MPALFIPCSNITRDFTFKTQAARSNYLKCQGSSRMAQKQAQSYSQYGDRQTQNFWKEVEVENRLFKNNLLT